MTKSTRMGIPLKVMIDGDVSQALKRSLEQDDAEGLLEYPFSFPELQESLLSLRDNGRKEEERAQRTLREESSMMNSTETQTSSVARDGGPILPLIPSLNRCNANSIIGS